MPDTSSPDGFSAGLTVFFRRQQVQVHEIVQSEAERYTVWVQGESGQVQRVIDLLPLIPQIVAYRHHPTGEAVLELYALGAEIPARARSVCWINRVGGDLGRLVDVGALEADESELQSKIDKAT
jgi:hypothetical protein